MSDTPELLTPQQVAAVLNCTRRHVYHLVERQRLTAAVQQPKMLRISRDELNNYIKNKGQPCANS